MGHQHERDSEGVPFNHGRIDDTGMPAIMRWSIRFIKDVGFPIAMCIVLSYFLLVQVKKNTEALTELKIVMVSLQVTLSQMTQNGSLNSRRNYGPN